jgi:hypothetical protein
MDCGIVGTVRIILLVWCATRAKIIIVALFERTVQATLPLPPAYLRRFHMKKWTNVLRAAFWFCVAQLLGFLTHFYFNDCPFPGPALDFGYGLIGVLKCFMLGDLGFRVVLLALCAFWPAAVDYCLPVASAHGVSRGGGVDLLRT